MAEVPEELITEILPCLPVKSIKRFRCLSKPLCAFIDSPNFMSSHSSKSSQNFKLILQDPSRKKFHVYDANLDHEQEVLSENPLSSPSKLVYGYYKGLLLLYRDQLTFAFWNPATRQYKNLPVIPVNPVSDPHPQSYTIIGCGLAYDDSVDDYKVFCIVLVGLLDIQVWICGLKSSIWRKSQNWKFAYFISYAFLDEYLFPGIGLFIPTDGVLCWVCTVNGYRHVNSYRQIVALDVKKEIYSILPPPKCLLNSDSVKRDINHPLSYTLHMLEGHLCIGCVNTVPLQADLYIRWKDEGGRFAWAQIFSVTEPLFVDKVWFETVQVLGFLKRGRKIMLDLGTNYLVSFDLKEKTFEKVEIDKDSSWKFPIFCNESLVPLS